jgi:hypothetical protein
MSFMASSLAHNEPNNRPQNHRRENGRSHYSIWLWIIGREPPQDGGAQEHQKQQQLRCYDDTQSPRDLDDVHCIGNLVGLAVR